MALYDYEIGLTYGGMANVEGLTVTLLAPRHTFQDFSQELPLASGGQKGGGWPLASWTWAYVTQAQRNQLKTFCPTGLSADVFIKTRDASGAFAVFTAVLVWPIQEGSEKRAGTILDFELKFQDLQPYSP